MRKTKSRDPVKPVAIVISWEEARIPLYTCIPLNISSDKMEDTRKDPPSVKAMPSLL